MMTPRSRMRLLLFTTGLLSACVGESATTFTLSAGFGEVKAFVLTIPTGMTVRGNGADSIFVVLDSAIQGYGVKPIRANFDSAMFVPVLIGQHETILRGFPASCSVKVRDVADTVFADSRVRSFPVFDNVTTEVLYVVRC